MPDNNNSLSNGHLEFEAKVAELDSQMNELRKLSSVKGIDYSAEIRRLQKQQVAAHPTHHLLPPCRLGELLALRASGASLSYESSEMI